ncbi:MAG: hypothetical protein JNK82_05165 [Myxococcaceae bacterium]|nr:hypothetical protein [Myxococcaceae bacterium]
MPRAVIFLLLLACESRGYLPGRSTASCSQPGECIIPLCPDACGGGQPACEVPRAYESREARRTCPCLRHPEATECRPPDDCVLPGCAVPQADGAYPDCVGGLCVTRLVDGGIVR